MTRRVIALCVGAVAVLGVVAYITTSGPKVEHARDEALQWRDLATVRLVLKLELATDGKGPALPSKQPWRELASRAPYRDMESRLSDLDHRPWRYELDDRLLREGWTSLPEEALVVRVVPLNGNVPIYTGMTKGGKHVRGSSF
ncbi:hypothetical protein BH11ARM2_BH11ARM2_29610 [soil metagenome]